MGKRIGVLALLVIAAAVVVSVLVRRPAEPGEWIEASGVVEATEVDVSSLVGGRLLRVLVEEGQWVDEGEAVAEVDPKDVEPQVTQARGAREAARGQLAQTEAVLAGAEKAVANAREAYAKSTELKGQYETAQARYQAAVAARSQAKAALDLVRAGAREEEIAQARAAAASAEASFENADRELARLEALLTQGAVAQQQVDRQRAARDGAKGVLDGARARLAEAETGARGEEKRQAEAAYRQAQANVEAASRTLAAARELYADKLALKQQLNAAEAQLQGSLEARAAAAGQLEGAGGALAAAEKRLLDTRIVAPISGAVTLKIRESGEAVGPGQAIVRVADLAHMWLRVYVPITELDRVKLGQEAEVAADASSGKSYRGKVTEISQQAEFTPKNVQTREQRTKLVFGVKVEVENPNRELKPGMPADARIRVGRRGGDG